jgi:hypothetical protein
MGVCRSLCTPLACRATEAGFFSMDKARFQAARDAVQWKKQKADFGHFMDPIGV